MLCIENITSCTLLHNAIFKNKHLDTLTVFYFCKQFCLHKWIYLNYLQAIIKIRIKTWYYKYNYSMHTYLKEHGTIFFFLIFSSRDFNTLTNGFSGFFEGILNPALKPLSSTQKSHCEKKSSDGNPVKKKSVPSSIFNVSISMFEFQFRFL